MKKIIYTFATSRKNGDSFSSYDFDKDAIEKKAKDEMNHLTDGEIQNLESAYIVGHEVTLPDDCTLSAEELVRDLLNDEIEIPEFDACLAMFKDSSECFFKELI